MTKANIREQEAYSAFLEDFRPKRPILRNIVVAFFTGGLICVAGQVVLSFILSRGMPEKQAYALTSTVMVFFGAFLTGLGVYDKLGSFAGMGAALPITGFANSVVSPAMEFKREGFVLGVGARMFQVAGPVIVYATLSATIVSLIKLYLF